MGKRGRGRPRRTTKTLKHDEEKPLEKHTEGKESTAEPESSEEGKIAETSGSSAVVSVPLPQPSDSNDDKHDVEEVGIPESKKRKLGDAEESNVEDKTSDSDEKNEVEKVSKQEETGGATIRIERCNSGPVYKRNANLLSEELKKAFPEIQIAVNPQKPRSKSFEVILCKEEGTEVVIWTGIKKGPARKLKFPDNQVVIEIIKNNL